MHPFFERRFHLAEHGTTVKTEVLAGMISFFTIVYIIAVNALILSEAGIPLQAGIVATVVTCFVGCLLVAFLGNAPLLIVPGMGVNALFSYTIVQGMGLPWQEALGAVFVAGILFTIVAFTPLSHTLSRSIPKGLKEAITVGIGLFLTLIGLEKGGIVVGGNNAILALGDFHSPEVLATVVTLLIALVLFIRNVPANFLLTIIAGSLIGHFFGVENAAPKQADVSLSNYLDVFAQFSFQGIFSVAFWIAVFSLAMVLVFENIGLIHGQTEMIGKPEKYKRSIRATAISSMLSGLFGTSPTVSTVEAASGITAGGRTGLTSLVSGLLFLVALFFLPVISLIPNTAIAPILIIIGGLMLENVKGINFKDFSEAFPAFLVIVIIPFTYSIVDGMAFGFVAYPFMKLVLGRYKEVSVPLYIIAGLFLMNFFLHGI
ncbi:MULTISPECIES: NCS2 family permease [Priestia]|uniref:Permease n=1 Tax=Priestia filamentosa TaxID=1402861 RepID=A0A0H4KCL5_9BACI|nr:MULTISPECIES: NCS2 family permease [Priestia]AKO91842.1 permease [Priestia filamentosa]MCY8231130.1 NCS2 family permease [Priestia endophytica]MDT3761987.1 NCS2 family permease [Priestia filamentosa]MED4073555.1 NCS2 family permease [Priestia endophytica]RJS64726.1 NCS2 family permease [Priestia filamentosa]